MKAGTSNWRSVSFSRQGRESVPENPGVYAILRANRVMGLPMQLQPIYVGKTKNLRKRMGIHLDPAMAHNEHVGAVNDRETLEFWCNLVPQELLASAEKALIQVVNPTANKIRYY